ncbi:MAG: DUF1761 domain-containing protein [Nitratireductor sp.]
MDGAFGISLITVLAAAIASFVFGGIYYGVLSKPWMKASGMSEADVKDENGKQPLAPLAIGFISGIVIAYMLAVLLNHTSSDGFTMGSAIFAAFSIWLGFVLTTQTVNHRYGNRPWSLTIIDSAHWLGVLVVQAIVMALMGL